MNTAKVITSKTQCLQSCSVTCSFTMYLIITESAMNEKIHLVNYTNQCPKL